MENSELINSPFEINNQIAADDKAGRLAVRQKLEDLIVAMQEVLGSETGDMEEINDNGLTEHFIDGAYIRELLIPEGITIVSRLWSKDRFWIITEGEVTITSELGKQRIKAPYSDLAPYGTKVAIHAHKDTRWFAITGAKAKNSDEVAKEVLAENHSECTYSWDTLEDNRGET